MGHVDSGYSKIVKLAIGTHQGVPHFFEWIKEIPPKDQAPPYAKYIQREYEYGKIRYFRISRAYELYLDEVSLITRKAFDNKETTFFCLKGRDGDSNVLIEVGEKESRYTLDIMRRLLNPDFDPSRILRLSPYRIEGDGKIGVGVAAMHPPDTKFSYTRESEFLKGCPSAQKIELRGKIFWDFSEVFEWLYSKLQYKLNEKKRIDNKSANYNVSNKIESVSSLHYGDEHISEKDDLPF